MKTRSALLITLFTGGILVALYAFGFLFQQPASLARSVEKDDPTMEDGIRQAQEQDFRHTLDPSLGYVPKSRLVAAEADLMDQRQHALTGRVEAVLSWTERGSYTDAVGVSNGNGRPGTPTPVTSGRIRSIWVDLADATSKTVWIGGADGGLWKTTDITTSPANWTPVNDFFGNLAISSICQDPSNNNIMYFGTGEKTFNVDAVLGGGIWKSTDHGLNWTLLANTVNFYNVSKVLCDASGNIYVATIGSGSGLQRSTDGGNNWTNITPTTAGGGTRIADMEMSNTGRLHVSKGYSSSAGQFGYFYTDNPSTVTSATWNAPATPFTSTQYNVDLAVTGNTVYALAATSAYQTPTVYKSTDGGANWASSGGSLSTSGNNAVSSGQGWYCLAIAVDPANSNNVIVGGLNCYATTNGGTSWSQKSVWVSGISGTVTNYVHADQHAMTWNGNQILVASDGGLFYSGDAGGTFTDRNVNLRLKQFYSVAIHPSTTNYFIGGAQDNGVHQFNGAGLTSSVEVSGGDGALVAIDQNEPAYQFGTYVYNHFHRSTNSGSTWSDFDFYKGNIPANYTDFGSFINAWDYDDAGNAIYAGGDAGEFFRWTNPQTLAAGTYHAGGSGFPAGVSLVSITGFGTDFVSAVTVSPFTSNRVYFGTDAGKVVRVDNANTVVTGSAGTAITGGSFPAGTVSSIIVGASDNDLIVTFSNYGVTRIWSTTNGGTSWTAIDGNLPDMPVRWALYYPGDDTKAVIATEMGVYETSLINGASTVWINDASFPVVRTDMLQYRSSDRTVVAATHGRGMWSATFPIVTPITLLDFTASLHTYIDLDWSTTSETNSKFFDIQKSTEGTTFYSIGTVNAASNSTTTRSYHFLDKQVSEFNYYRLRMVDADGKFTYSKTVLVKNPGVSQQLWIVNNPVTDQIGLRFAKKPIQPVFVELFNAAGSSVYHQQLSPATVFTVPIGNRLSKGVYVLRATVDGKVFSQKLIKQ